MNRDSMAFREAVRRLRREEALRATLHTLARLGCDALQLRDVAAAASISRTTIYLDYKTRQSLIDAALSSAADALLAQVEAELAAAPGISGVLAAVDQLIEAAQAGTDAPLALPCCLRHTHCPWSQWDRLDAAIVRAVQALPPRPVAEDPMDPKEAGLLLRVLLLAITLDSERRLSRSHLTRAFQFLLGLEDS